MYYTAPRTTAGTENVSQTMQLQKMDVREQAAYDCSTLCMAMLRLACDVVYGYS